MNCILSFSAEGIVRDVDTNNISAYNILEQLNSPGFPLFKQQVHYFAFLSREDAEPSNYDLNLVVSNNDQTLLEVPLTADFQDQLRNRQIVRIGGIAIPSPGQLIFRLLHGEQELSVYSVQITLVGEPEATTLE